MAEPSSIPTSSVWGFQSFHVLSVIIICRFNYSHPSECSGYLIIVLICLFRWLRCPAFFHVLIVHLHKEKPIWILCPSLIVFYLFDYWVVGVFIYILDTSPLSDVWFFKKNFPFCGLSFYFVDGVLRSTEVFHFADVQFMYFFFWCLYFLCHI